MKIYNYHPITKEYIGESIADESPLEEGVFLIPAYSTYIQVPEFQAGKVTMFNEETQQWQQVSIEFANAETPLELTNEEKLSIIRQHRNQLLFECDWTQLADCPLSIPKIAEWSSYRQQLRDFPAIVDLENIIYPIKPI
jgi:hypothetical protein